MKPFLKNLSILLLLCVMFSCQKEISKPITDGSSGGTQVDTPPLVIKPTIEIYNTGFPGETRIAVLQDLIFSMKAGKTNIALALIGDSTGNETWEWFYKFLEWLLSVFPKYTIEYHLWDSNADNYSPTVKIIKGAQANDSTPVLIVYNGSRPGANIGLLSDAARTQRFLPAANYKAIIMSCSHNDATDTGSVIISKWRKWRQNIRAVTTKGQLVVVTQNPETSPAKYQKYHAIRRDNLLKYHDTDSMPVIDTYKAFYDDGRAMNLLVNPNDGIHPLSEGAKVWANKVIYYASRYL